MNCALCVWLSVCVCISIYYDYNIQTASAPRSTPRSPCSELYSAESEYKVSATLTHLDYFIAYIIYRPICDSDERMVLMDVHAKGNQLIAIAVDQQGRVRT